MAVALCRGAQSWRLVGMTVARVLTATCYGNWLQSDRGCVSTGTVTVTVHPLPSVTDRWNE